MGADGKGVSWLRGLERVKGGGEGRGKGEEDRSIEFVAEAEETRVQIGARVCVYIEAGCGGSLPSTPRVYTHTSTQTCSF